MRPLILILPLNNKIFNYIKKLLLNYITVIKRTEKINNTARIFNNVLRVFLKLLKKYFDIINYKVILYKNLKKKRNALKKRYGKTAEYIKDAKNYTKKYTVYALVAKHKIELKQIPIEVFEKVLYEIKDLFVFYEKYIIR